MKNETARREIESLDYYLQNHTDDYSEESHTATMMVADALSSSEKPTEWIPVNERLPEEDTAVLIWCPERRNIYCAYLEEKQWWIFGAYFQKVPLEVIAWMPLPQPYKAESEG